ncbi:MAG: hypothetical protein Q8K93_14260, partial [Reyranella sp.]|nr:hypothetical protein [Reyranella sp.]
ARKYRLCLTLAHQFMSQVKTKVRDAIFGNVGSIIAFRVGHEDAQALEKAIGDGIRAEDFTSLNNRDIYAKLLVHGKNRFFRFLSGSVRTGARATG